MSQERSAPTTQYNPSSSSLSPPCVTPFNFLSSLQATPLSLGTTLFSKLRGLCPPGSSTCLLHTKWNLLSCRMNSFVKLQICKYFYHGKDYVNVCDQNDDWKVVFFYLWIWSSYGCGDSGFQPLHYFLVIDIYWKQKYVLHHIEGMSSDWRLWLYFSLNILIVVGLVTLGLQFYIIFSNKCSNFKKT